MSSSFLQLYPILQEVTLKVFEEIQYQETILETYVKLSENGKQIVELVLVDNVIMLYLQENGQTTPLAYIRIEFFLKFQRIFQTKSPFQRQLKGFRLINHRCQQITFYFKNRSAGNEWMLYLSNLLNETEFKNSYTPIRTLGKGSYGTVYEIARLDDGCRFATKVFSKEILRKNKMWMKSFMDELEILRSIDHRNVLSFKGVFQSQSTFYLITEALLGGNMKDYLRCRKQFLSPIEIRIIMCGLLKGLSYLQQSGIVHRDIKPQNIMMRGEGSMEPVIVDFGLAVYEDDLDYYHRCGTAGFISPEVLTLQQGQKLTPKSDIFSAGVVLHILLTGKYLFTGKDQDQVMSNNLKMDINLEGQQYSKIDHGLHDLLKRMLAKDPEMRLSASQCLQHISLRPMLQKQYPYRLSSKLTDETCC